MAWGPSSLVVGTEVLAGAWYAPDVQYLDNPQVHRSTGDVTAHADSCSDT